MIINRGTLLALRPIKNMLSEKIRAHRVSHGLGEAGYDIRIKQTITFRPSKHDRRHMVHHSSEFPSKISHNGRFVLASAMEEFQMPTNLVGVVHDKSTWARKGLSVFNTVIEPGWCGFLTLELVYHGNTELVIPAGAGIAQVLFHATSNDAQYDGKYQHQEDMPIPARS